jgi:oxygen-dependent protoporphyrinogen oxidase
VYDVAVVGAGVAGLTVAYRLLDAGRSVICLEADQSAGGCVRTDRVGGFLCERGAQNVLEETGGPVCQLASSIGISGEIQSAREKGNYIAWHERLFSMPSQLLQVLSVRGALRAARGFVAPSPPSDAGASVSSWASRRLGDEFARRIVDPMVCGVYAGDPDRLSLHATFPAITEFERTHRSMLIAAFRSKPVKRSVYTFRNGMETLTSTLARQIGPALRTGCKVSGIDRTSNRAYRVEGDGFTVEARTVVLATPAHVAASLLSALDEKTRSLLEGIRCVPIASAALAFAGTDLISGPPKGYGFVRPYCDGSRILGCLFSSSAFDGFAPAKSVLIRVLFGGQRHREDAGLPEERLADIAMRELRPILRIRANASPRFFHVARHWPGLPQYEVGHVERVRAIEERIARLPGLYLTGNSYSGLSVSKVVEGAERLSESMLQRRAAA